MVFVGASIGWRSVQLDLGKIGRPFWQSQHVILLCYHFNIDAYICNCSWFFWVEIAILPVFFLSGAITDGRSVGFQSALLEMAPEAQRSTYAGLNVLLTLPIAFLSLAAGLFLQHWSYSALFLITAVFVGAGTRMIHHWATK